MGRNKVKQPAKLPAKLKKIRARLGISQTQMYALLYPHRAHLAKVNRAHISAYEKGKRTPPLLEVLAYTQILRKKTGIEISTDDLINDRRKLSF